MAGSPEVAPGARPLIATTRSRIGLYAAVARRSSRRYSTYRAATLAGAFTNTIFGCLRAFVLIAVWRHRPNLGGYDVTDAVTYVFLGQALIAVLAIGGMPLTLVERIRTGDIVVDLTRPVDLQTWWLAEDVGRSLYMVIFRGLPPFFIGALLFDVRLPTSPVLWLGVSAALVVGIVVGFSLRYLAALSAFWLLDSRGVDMALFSAMYFFSGLILPLGIFPGWLEPLARALPFAAMLQVPADLFLGKPALGNLLLGALWAGALMAAGGIVTRRATQRLVVQGG